MTADYVAFHASQRPDAVAILDRGREISYARLSRDIDAFTRAVREFGLSRGSLVAIAWGDAYVHWLLLLAFERLGIATASYLSGEGSKLDPLIASADLVISGQPGEALTGKRHHVISETWLRGIFEGAGAGAIAPVPKQPNDPLRILRTSGTTGSQKRLLLTRRMLEAWIDRWIWSLEITRASRYLLNAPFTITGLQTLAAAVVRSGGTVVIDNMDTSASMGAALAQHAITHVVFAPIVLQGILDALPADFVKPASLTIATIGAPTAAPLREKALARLASEVVVYYGSNEIPFIAETRASGSEGPGSVFPWVRAEVVDDNGAPLPPGAVGRIRLQADAMATGYIADPQATAVMFRDGWFYPGDMGILQGPRRLQIVGRVDDLLNIGGQKLWPSDLEAMVLRHATVTDVGVCSFPNANGVQEIYVMVAGAQGGDQELLGQVRQAFAAGRLGGFFIVRVDRIPRNANGKIERQRLKELLVEQMPAHQRRRF